MSEPTLSVEAFAIARTAVLAGVFNDLKDAEIFTVADEEQIRDVIRMVLQRLQSADPPLIEAIRTKEEGFVEQTQALRLARGFANISAVLARGRSMPRPRGYVYLARRDGQDDLVKIGVTSNLKKRQRSLQAAASQAGIAATIRIVAHRRYEDIYQARVAEKLFHEDFSADRVHGEWFRFTPEIRDLMKLFLKHPEGPMF